MTQDQATAIIVLLSIPVGVLCIAVVFGVLGGVLDGVRSWRSSRQYKKEERLRECESKALNLRFDFERLAREVTKLTPKDCPEKQ